MKKTLLIITALLVTLISQAATIIVDNINDTGTGSLRQAATDAISGDTIRFNPSLLTSVVDSISLSTEIDFGAKGIVIKGLYTATDTLFISGANSSRIFSFIGAGKVVLDSLVLINGNGVGATNNDNGGAVSYVQATDTLHISNSIIKGNTASASGGGIYFEAFNTSTVNISRSTISGNTASYGGGIYSEAPGITVNISYSTISGNTAYEGGGIFSYSYVSASNVNISYSTIVGNTASNDGGGVYSLGPATDVNISRSTISGNTAIDNGGGVYLRANGSGCVLTVNNSTFSGNTANNGGGTFIFDQAGTSVNIGSSIFDGSTIWRNGSSNITPSQGYNIFTDAPTGVQSTDNSNVSPASIILQPLAFNGGTTQTMLPGPNSIAIDMGNPADMSDAQNRSISGGIRDVGAAETSCITVAGTHNETVCFGDSIVVNGTVYNANNLTGTEVFTNVGTNNCDSTVTVTLTFENAIDVTTTANGVTITANQTGATYQWIDCNNNQAINGATNANFTATADGIYAVVITVGNCSDTSDCVTINTASLDEQAGEMNLYLFPNPATSTLTIENGGMNIKAISIVDVTGKTLATLMGNSSTIDVSKLNKGIYFLQIHTDKGLVSKKFIKK